MGGASVDLQLLGHLATQGALGQHANDGAADSKLGLLSQQLAVLGFLQAANVAAVMVLDLLVQLLAGHDDLIGIDDDDVVTGINIGGVNGLVLTTQDVRNLAGKAAVNLTLSVNDIPLTGDVRCFRHKSLQRYSSSGWLMKGYAMM